MCGIVGFISKSDQLFTKEKQHFMHFGLTLDTLRGYDSTGIISVSERFKVATQKSLMPGDKFVHSAHYKRHNLDSWCKIGHNRAATAGSVKINNAHPFTFGMVSLVHNGTLYGKGSSMDTFDKELDVDSMQIALGLSMAPPEDAAKVLAGIDGSFAIVWTDARDESVNMARNSDRPLHFTRNAATSIMWFMSDPLHLKSINKSLWKTPADGDTIFQMDKMKICKFKKGSLIPEVTKFLPFVRPVTPLIKRISYRGKDYGTGKTALERATEQWEKATKLSGDETQIVINGDGLRLTDMRITVNKRERKLLLTHVKLLRKNYDLNPGLPRCFQPIEKYLQENGRYTVVGDMLHTEWGDCPMDAIIYDVRPAMANAYMKVDWMVNPVGLSRPHVYPDKKGALPLHSIICSLINCDWARHNPYEDEIPVEENPDPKALNLISVGDQKMYSDKFFKMSDGGCIQCGASMNLDDAASCVVVNTGQDLLCGGCVATLNSTKDAKNPPPLKTLFH
jgi:predicted glutamine amidotransferase